MRKQLKGIGLLLFSILLTIANGDKPFFDLDFSWSLIYVIMGIVGVIVVALPWDKDKEVLVIGLK